MSATELTETKSAIAESSITITINENNAEQRRQQQQAQQQVPEAASVAATSASNHAHAHAHAHGGTQCNHSHGGHSHAHGGFGRSHAAPENLAHGQSNSLTYPAIESMINTDSSASDSAASSALSSTTWSHASSVQLLQRIVSRLADPTVAHDPKRLQAVLSQIAQHPATAPNIMRDIVCFQIEQGTLSADRALLDAIILKDFILAQSLIDHSNPNVNACDPSDNFSVLQKACYVSAPTQFIRNLVAKGANWEFMTDAKKQTVFHLACLGGSLSALITLVNIATEQTASKAAALKFLSMPDVFGLQPIHYAAQKGHTVIVDYLQVQVGTDVLNAQDKKGRSCFHWSVANKHALTSEWLLKHGADFTLLDHEQLSVMHWASLRGDFSIIVQMLEHGGAPLLGVRDNTNSTPAMLAAQKGFHSLTKYLDSEWIAYHSFWRRTFCRPSPRKNSFLQPFWFLSSVLLSVFHYAFWIHPSLDSHLLPVSILLYALAGIALTSFVICALSDPGFLPAASNKYSGGKIEDDSPVSTPSSASSSNVAIQLPVTEEDGNRLSVSDLDLSYEDCLLQGKSNLVCVTCRVLKPPRVKHCKFCDRCVDRLDHHCGWLGNCVGRKNHRSFICLIVFVAAAAFLDVGMILYFLSTKVSWSVANPAIWIAIFCILNDIFCGVFASVLSSEHVRQVFINMTTNEMMNSWRYGYLMDGSGLFFNPFDQGATSNCFEFWGCRQPTPMRDLPNLRLSPPTPAEIEKNRLATRQAFEEAKSSQTFPCLGGHNHSHGGSHGHSH